VTALRGAAIQARETCTAQQLNLTRVALRRNVSERLAWHSNSSVRDLRGDANQVSQELHGMAQQFKRHSNAIVAAIQAAQQFKRLSNSIAKTCATQQLNRKTCA
jgi:hypothetical protein